MTKLKFSDKEQKMLEEIRRFNMLSRDINWIVQSMKKKLASKKKSHMKMNIFNNIHFYVINVLSYKINLYLNDPNCTDVVKDNMQLLKNYIIDVKANGI